jgi:YHS domain-containing protein
MRTTIETAFSVVVQDGVTYAFCSDTCVRVFERDSARFV